MTETLDSGRARRRGPAHGWASSRWACGSASSWPPPCWATRRSSSSTSPSNGLDPQGIQWLPHLHPPPGVRSGNAVLVASDLLSEMEETVDDVVIVSHGRLVLQTTLADLATQRRYDHRAADPLARAAPT